MLLRSVVLKMKSGCFTIRKWMIKRNLEGAYEKADEC